MNKNKEFTANGFVYIINEEEGTASISDSTLSTSKVIIPTSIKKSSKEYIITSILPGAFFLSRINTILFSPDSKLRTIHHCSFQTSAIKNLLIPSSVIELEKGWCCETHYLNKITISPYNPRYYLLDKTMIIGKSSLDSKEYDTLVFCS